VLANSTHSPHSTVQLAVRETARQ